MKKNAKSNTRDIPLFTQKYKRTNARTQEARFAPQLIYVYTAYRLQEDERPASPHLSSHYTNTECSLILVHALCEARVFIL